MTFEGSGHVPHARDPVRVNLLLHDFGCPAPPPRVWTRGRVRTQRAVFVSSPIGLGHAQRDVAIADELRRLRPDLQIDWLAQSPVTTRARGAGRAQPPGQRGARQRGRPHPVRGRANLHVLRRVPRMDEILDANSMGSTTSPATSRPPDRARRGVGARLLPAREPRAEDRRLCLADRLRRLAAGAGRGPARGGADGRLQRRDDRADRALPTRPRPLHLHRRARRHRAAHVRRRPALDPGVDGAALRLRRLRHGLRPGGAARPSASAGGARLRRRRSAWRDASSEGVVASGSAPRRR